LSSTWLQNLAPSADIFTKAKELNLSQQGKYVSIFKARDKISAFKRKLQFYGKGIKCKNVEYFPTLSYFFVNTESELQEIVFNDITAFKGFAMHDFEILPPSTRQSFVGQKSIFSEEYTRENGISE
jgi:hypothetical protein